MVSISRPATHLAGIMEVRVVMLLASVLLLAGVFTGTLCGFDSARIDSDEGIRCSTLATSILSFSASPNRVYTGEEVTFTATASSTTPDTSLTFIIYYDAIVPPYPTNNTNSPYTVHVTGNPGTVTARFAYDRLGNLTTGTDTYFCVRLVVSDGSATTASNLISVYVVENRPPTFEIALSESLPVLVPGEEICMSVRVSDPDGDPVIANWDFGDGSQSTRLERLCLVCISIRLMHGIPLLVLASEDRCTFLS
jgi:hypothetical protein